MAKRKKADVTPMPPDIDLEAWETSVEDKRERIAYDEAFLGLMEWFILADTAADTIMEQFGRCLPEGERRLITALLMEISTCGYAMQDPDSYYGEEEDEFIEGFCKVTSNVLPMDIIRALTRLTYHCMMAKYTINNNNPYGY